MEDKMYVFYLKTDRVVTVIGDEIGIDHKGNFINIFHNQKLQAKFTFDGIEGFIIKKVTENDTRKEL